MKKIGWTFCALMALSACGSGPSVSLGLPRDKAVSSLSPDELKTGCRNTLSSRNLNDDAIRGACALNLAHDGATACQNGLDACVASSKAYQAQGLDPAQCDDPSNLLRQGIMSCAVTVGELEDCLSAIKDTNEAYLSNITCTNLPTSSGMNLTDTPACAPLKTKCPALFGDDMVSPAP